MFILLYLIEPPTIFWLVVWNIFYFPFHIWDVILPIDELHHFSRLFFNHQQDTYRYYKSLNIDHFFIKSSIEFHVSSSNPHKFPLAIIPIIISISYSYIKFFQVFITILFPHFFLRFLLQTRCPGPRAGGSWMGQEGWLCRIAATFSTCSSQVASGWQPRQKRYVQCGPPQLSVGL